MLYNKDFRQNDLSPGCAQLVFTDIPYNIGKRAYGSNPQWYEDTSKQGALFFDTDEGFDVVAYLHEAARVVADRGAVFTCCSFEQFGILVDAGKACGLRHSFPFVLAKTSSPDVLKCNMKTSNFLEFAVLQYRDKLPLFNANGHQQSNILPFVKGPEKRIHPTQKPVALIEEVIRRYTRPGDLVVDFCAGSGSTLIAAHRLGRRAIGYEIDPHFYARAKVWIDSDDLQHF